MPNWRAVRRLLAPVTLKSRFGRQVPLSGEESPPQYPCHSCKNAKYASQLHLSPRAALYRHRPERRLFRQIAQIIVARPLG